MEYEINMERFLSKQIRNLKSSNMNNNANYAKVESVDRPDEPVRSLGAYTNKVCDIVNNLSASEIKSIFNEVYQRKYDVLFKEKSNHEETINRINREIEVLQTGVKYGNG